MSFIGKLFGGGNDTPPPPQPLAAAPTINDAASHSAALAEASHAASAYGTDKTLLTKGGLGDTGSVTGNIAHTSALGGNSSLTPTS